MIKYKNTKVIEVTDWDNLITETYGKPYSFQQQDGCKSRGVHVLTIPSQYAESNDLEMNENILFEINGDEMGVKFNTWLNTSVEEINKKHPERYRGQNNLFWDRNFYPDVDVIANDLHKKGLIEKGEYTINIDW